MSECTTLRITRIQAQLQIINKVFDSSNEVLAALMDEILRDRLYNCQVVEDGEPNDDQVLLGE